jgi:hypothetical protein
MCPSPDAVIATTASMQLGLITRAQALAGGMSASMIEHRLETGRWVRSRPSVFVIAGTPETWQQRVLSACLDAAPFGVASHATAGVLWSIIERPRDPIEVLVPYGKDARAPGCIVHRTRVPFGCALIGSIPATTPARTLVDLASAIGRDVEEALDRALFRRIVTVGAVGAEVDRRPMLRGSSALRGLLRERRDRRRHPEGSFETRVLRILVDAGLPRPEIQYEIRRDGHLVGRVDLCYPRERVFIELDGWAFHSSRRAFDRGHVRQNLIVELGWIPLGFTWADLERPHYIAGTVQRVLEQRSPF